MYTVTKDASHSFLLGYLLSVITILADTNRHLGQRKIDQISDLLECSIFTAFFTLFGLASAQFDSICAGDNGNTACCVNTGNVPSQDSTYMFMPEDIAANQLLFCNINGGRLAYIETIAENDCINQYIQEGESDSGSDGMLRTWM